MSNQINHKCWFYNPGSPPAPPSPQPGNHSRQSTSQPGRVAGHTAGDNFIPSGKVPRASGGGPSIAERGVNRDGQVPFKYTKIVSHLTIEGEATPDEISKFFAPDNVGSGFPIFSHPFCQQPGCTHCNDPQWVETPTPPATPSGSPQLPVRHHHHSSSSFGRTMQFNGNMQPMAQSQR